MLVPAVAVKRDVHIDLKLDLHESLRQAMPECMLSLSLIALQVTVISLCISPLSAVVIDHPTETYSQPSCLSASEDMA